MAFTVMYLDTDGCPLPKGNDLIYPHLAVEIYRNPEEYTRGATTKREWNLIGAHVREMNKSVCQGAIQRGFFSHEKHVGETSVVFVLLGVRAPRRGNVYGFALCNDLMNERHFDEREDDEKSLYIDALCANPAHIRGDRRVALKASAGKILMNAIETYAKKERFKNIRLSALPYVIHYYRKLGYRHIRPGEKASSEDPTITDLANKVGTKRYGSDIEIENAHKVEMALAFLSLGNPEERRDAEIRNLNAYFPDFFFARDKSDPSRVYIEPRAYEREDLDSRYAIDREEKEVLRSLEELVNDKLSEKARNPGHTETAH